VSFQHDDIDRIGTTYLQLSAVMGVLSLCFGLLMELGWIDPIEPADKVPTVLYPTLYDYEEGFPFMEEWENDTDIM
jgi:hypothetical protein